MAQSMSLPPPMDSTSSKKPIHSIILDTGPLINNTISISTIIGSAEQLYTTPAIISEIRDAATRSRVETTLMPFLNIKTPTPASYEAVSAFAKKTGDFSVLSRQDLGILALAYEVHCERHGGTFGLREEPGKPVKKTPEQEDADRKADEKRKEKNAAAQKEEKKVDASPENVEQNDKKQTTRQSEKKNPAENLEAEVIKKKEEPVEEEVWESVPKKKIGGKKFTNKKPKEPVMLMKKAQAQADELKEETAPEATQTTEIPAQQEGAQPEKPVEEKVEAQESTVEATPAETLDQDISNLTIIESIEEVPVDSATPTSEDDSDDSDSDWITPENLTAHQAKDTGAAPVSTSTSVPQISVATMTTDYAMQNVLLQMNLNLLSPAMQRIRQIRSTILRCHACFLTIKQMDKQFCPRCGGATLARVTCSTDKKGVFRIHLSKKYQYNKRGDRYSVPKPVAGSANGKLREKGGGQGGWGRDLVLTEDQKEYTRQIEQGNRLKTRDLMDDDYLPGILTGDRGKAGGRPKVGAGRNINSKKRF